MPANSNVRLPNVIVREALDRKVIGAAKLQDAEVEEFAQLPFVTVHEPPADETMYPAALSTVRLPVTATADAFDRRIAPAPLTVIAAFAVME